MSSRPLFGEDLNTSLPTSSTSLPQPHNPTTHHSPFHPTLSVALQPSPSVAGADPAAAAGLLRRSGKPTLRRSGKPTLRRSAFAPFDIRLPRSIARTINVVASDVDQSSNSSYNNRSNDYHNHKHNHNHLQQQQQQQQQKMTALPPPPTNGGVAGKDYSGGGGGGDGGDGFKKEIRDLEEMLSKLNPMAEEFIPNQRPQLLPSSAAAHFGYAAVNNFLIQTNNTGFANGTPTRRV